PLNKGIWSEKTTLKLAVDDGSAHSHFSTAGYNSHKTQVEVEVDSIDNIVKEKIDFIKADIESCELALLEGGIKTFATKPRLLIEINKFTLQKFMNKTVNDLLNALIKYNYTKFMSVNNGQIYSAAQLSGIFNQLPEKSLMDVYVL